MLNPVQKTIKKDKQIKKFCAYGFLKNLKFFEPYLIIFLMSKNINFFEVGILIAIREVIVNVFEVPSGIIADYFGRKKELCVSFIFYIISFICFFYTNGFIVAIIAMIFFGLGEAFRSGTHKAMIYTYLNHKAWEGEKTFVYGRTRSFSLIGSAISSLIGIILIITLASPNSIFIASIIPYIINFFLILSYPAYLDTTDTQNSKSIKNNLIDFLKQLVKNYQLRNMLLEDGIFSATISFVKDLIQPMLEAIIIGSSIVLISSLTEEDNLNIILGIVYATLNLFGAYSSKKAYVIKKNKTNTSCLIITHILLGIALLFLGILYKNIYIILFIFLIIYSLFNIRKPIFVDEIDEHIDKSKRATILSISSQLKSLFLMIFAPLLGFITDTFGINITMYSLVLIFLISLPLLVYKKNESSSNKVS